MTAAIALTLAQLADVVTALTMPSTKRELNPIAGAMLDEPVLAIAAKLALVSLLVAVYVIASRRRPRVATSVVLAGILAGVVGAVSNA